MIGKIISHYRILEPLGQGGMGKVYKAEDLELKRIVALKFLTSHAPAEQQEKQRFLEEAQKAAALNHSNIATIYDVAQTAGLSYIVMEYIEGETLAQKIEQGRLAIHTTLQIAIRVAEALKEAHAHRIIHCDIKSANILFTLNGNVKVLDFGLARRACGLRQTATEESVSLSHSSETSSATTGLPQNDIAGTTGYMSPEQARGELLDVRTDIFSCGIVLYEMLAGQRPFAGENPAAIFYAILHREPPSLSTFRDEAPLELENIIRKSLQKNREERYQSAADLLVDLNKLYNRLGLASTEEKALALATISESHEAEKAVAPVSAPKLIDLLWSYRQGLRVAGVLAALAAGLDLFLGQPEGKEWVWTGGLLFIAMVCFVGYFMPRRQSVRSLSVLPKGAAFRGLLPFQEADRDRFYGREIETPRLYEMMAHNDFRFGVLFGDSGSGKTSLLRAGLLPKLWKEGYVPIYCRSYKDPLAALLEECRKRSRVVRRDNEPMTDYLHRVAAELNATLAIICDQFEEFFVNFKTGCEREPFMAFVTTCNHSDSLPVKFLFSMRSDFLYLINAEFAGRIAEPLLSARLYHLRNFDGEQAAEIIAKSARRANLPFAQELIRKVARDLAVNGAILPSELQIVGEQLQSKRIYAEPEYLRAGGKEALVHGFLDDVIIASGEKEAAHLLLRSLISEENTRLTLPLQEIIKRIQRSAETVAPMLNLFVQARLIREIQEEEPWRYELMHEYLIEKINQITGKVMNATQRANRLLRQYLSNYAVDKRTRIPLTKLWFIRRYAEIDEGERGRELWRKSLRAGVLQTAVLTLLLAVIITALTAMLSIREEWESVRLHDGHTAAARQAVFSPDGRLLISCGEDAKVMVWDFARRERLATLTDHKAAVNAIAFAPDGKWFATGGKDSTIFVWDAEQLKKAAVWRAHQGQVKAVVFSPDGRLLATGGDDGWIIFWKAGGWKALHKMPFRTNNWYFLFLANGRRLMQQDGQVWDVETAQPLTDTLEIELVGNSSALSPEGTQVVTVSGDGNVLFLDPVRRQLLGRQRGHRDHGIAAAFSPNGRLVATGAENIVLWEAVTRSKLLKLEYTANVNSLAFSPDGRWLVSTHGDGAILLWDVVERERVADFTEHAASVRAVAFSRDGKLLASAGDDRSIIIWDGAANKKNAVLAGHDNIVKSLAFSPDGKWIASTDQDATVICWDVESRRTRWTFKYPTHAHAYDLAFSPDGNWVAATTGVYESAAGHQVVDFTANESLLGIVYGLAFSNDGRWLTTVSTEKIFLWDVKRWQRVDSLNVGKMNFKCVKFSPDGERLITGESQGTARLWQVHPLRQMAVLGQHAARIRSVAFSPDGREVVSASDDQTMALWNVKKRKLITRIGTHTAPVNAVAFSPDGKRLASGEHDKSVRIYTRYRTLWKKHWN